jgi:SAM-dependent methyltransferase
MPKTPFLYNLIREGLKMARAHRLKPLGPGHPLAHARSIPYYYARSPIVRHYFYKRLDELVTLVKRESGPARDVALDLGCFLGVVTFSLLEQHRLCVGVDIDPEYLRMARQCSEYEGKASACFVQADVFGLPFRQGSVGTITAASIFEHLPDSTRPFDEIERVLQPCGILVAGLPIEVGFPFLVKQLFFRAVRWPRQDRLSLSQVWNTFFYGEFHGPHWEAGHLDYNWRRTLVHIRSRMHVECLRFWPMHFLNGCASVYVTVRAVKPRPSYPHRVEEARWAR